MNEGKVKEASKEDKNKEEREMKEELKESGVRGQTQ